MAYSKEEGYRLYKYSRPNFEVNVRLGIYISLF